MAKKIPKKARLVSKRKKTIPSVSVGKIYIRSTFNNTIISITDRQGNVLAWGAAGSAGFKGTKKSTPFAAAQAIRKALERAKIFGLKEVEVLVSGVGVGRESAVRSLIGQGITVTRIKDITPVPHNGCRPKKIRRV